MTSEEVQHKEGKAINAEVKPRELAHA